MGRWFLQLAAVPLLISTALFSHWANAATLTVAVAANFKPTAVALQQVFEAQSEHRLRLVSASTGTLYNQIIHGAPYDIFFAADSEYPKKLEQQQLASNRKTYALGRLAVTHRLKTARPERPASFTPTT